MAFIFPSVLLHNLLFDFAFPSIIEEPWFVYIRYAEVLVNLALLIFLYHLYTRYIEKRKALEFNCNKGWFEYLTGLLVGAGMVAVVVGLMAILGYYRIEDINSPVVLVNKLFRYGMGTFIEELLFTLILFKLIEEFAGSVIAIAFVSLGFGLAHIGNDNATVLSALLICLAHITILAPFMLTRRIWFPWAIHLGWNYAQAAIFGMANSGFDQGGIITPVITGPEWLTGGAFGIEASYAALAINLIVGLVFLRAVIRRKQYVQPLWKRKL